MTGRLISLIFITLIRLLMMAGPSGRDIVNSACRDAAANWSLESFGAIAVGKSASVLVLDANPYADPMTLVTPSAVYIAGRPLKR